MERPPQDTYRQKNVYFKLACFSSMLVGGVYQSNIWCYHPILLMSNAATSEMEHHVA